ncbi:MAG TPA: AMP-binding protein [Candidatus Sulfotelmatobacter sp.]|jgi:long-chain acyl-CoA synthetase|nr:AMP-binding protein [Candidatus Sulfotelmatobacter sp.]
MLDLQKYSCLGAALRDALDRFSGETCLIEADRDREKTRLTYSDFKEIGLPLARALEDADFDAGDRAAILMTNQSKWLISAYAIFYSGGVLVPLDYKLTAAEQLQLLEHSKAKVLVVEYYLWRSIMQSPQFNDIKTKLVLVTEAPLGADLAGGFRWEDFKRKGTPDFVMRQREDVACIVYSSGTGGRPKGCVLTHENYLEQCKALTAWYPFWPGVRYLSILPTNHAIDFMVGFIGPFVCGACVVHLRTLRPEFVRDAFVRYRITYVSLVPMIVKNLERGLRAKFDELPAWKRAILNRLISLNKLLTRSRARVNLSRRLLPQVHRAFGGELLALITGGAFMEPSTMQFFYDLGIPVVNGYGLTEAGTALTLNDLKPFRADTVGKPLPGVELRVLSPNDEGIGEIAARSKTVMSHYLDDAELTLETIVDGWLLTGDLGRFDRSGHLQLFGRKKNMIVTEGGKNIYPEDIETVFDGLPVKEYCVFAANYVWPQKELGREMLLVALRLEQNQRFDSALLQEIVNRNRKLPDFKRVGGYLIWEKDFPRTASMKIKRQALAEEIGKTVERGAVVGL